MDPGFRTPYVLNASLEIERQLAPSVTLRVGTMWTHAVHLISSSAYDLNLQPLTGTTTYIVCPPGGVSVPCPGPKIVLPYAQKGLYPEALSELEKAGSATTEPLSNMGYVYARSGRPAEALKILDQLRADSRTHYVPAYSFARIFLALGRRDEGFAWLEKAYEERNFWLIFLRVEPQLDPVRDDPRFKELLRRIGFPP